MQGGSVKTMGILKPWAPTFSYGLIARLNNELIPVKSYHSRADGVRHGVTSLAIGQDDRIFVGVEGDGCVLELDGAET